VEISPRAGRPREIFSTGAAAEEISMTTLVVAEDHALVREGLKSLLKTDPTLKPVGDASDGLQAVKAVEELKPDLLVLDLMLPRLHGLEVLRQVRKLKTTKVLVVSMHAESPYVLEAFQSGAAGYLLKDSGAHELIKAIRLVISGQRYLSSRLTDMALNAYLKKVEGVIVDIYATLSSRERVVLQLAAEGNSSAQIGKQLFISPRTVETHRTNLMKKLSLRSQTELVRFAIRKKIIEA
jgi:DNA-binding NarL/FixJ family response regulator